MRGRKEEKNGRRVGMRERIEERKGRWRRQGEYGRKEGGEGRRRKTQGGWGSQKQVGKEGRYKWERVGVKCARRVRIKRRRRMGERWECEEELGDGKGGGKE